MKHIYRIEIPSKFAEGTKFFFWIGHNLELVPKLEDAIPVTEEEHLRVMETINCEAVAYLEKGGVL